MIRNRSGASIALLLLAAVTGCAGDGPPPATQSSAFDRIQQDIFNVSCLSAGCHNAADQAGTLVLAAGQSFDDLVNAVANNPTARDAGLLRVRPGAPDGSFLVIKLEGPPSSLLGSSMPLIGPPLSPEQIGLIRDWIATGAPPPVGTATATPTPTPTP